MPLPQPPICAPGTPLLPSALAVVRVSGPDLSAVLARLLALPEPRLASLRTLRWDGFTERALVLFFPAPASYTGEDLVELQVHGNPLLVRRLVDHLGTLGVRLAEPGEFTRRALLNGKQGLLEAEALRDLMAAETDIQLRLAQARAGALPPWIHEARQALVPWMARAEAALDYGEEEGISLDPLGLDQALAPLRARFHVEQTRARAAQHLQAGIRIPLVGRRGSVPRGIVHGPAPRPGPTPSAATRCPRPRRSPGPPPPEPTRPRATAEPGGSMEKARQPSPEASAA